MPAHPVAVGADVLPELSEAAGGHARHATDADSIDGVPARYVATPPSSAATGAVLAVASRHGLRVVARGAGTKQSWAHPPEAVDVVLDTSALRGVEHAAGDLIAVVGAGTPLRDLQRELAGAGQHLALDDPLPGATVGGTIAANTSGPRRLQYGTVRDLLIGVTFARADGVVAKAGGRVVKNVAGYDVGKVLTGSFGTLAIVTEAVFRLHPVPVARAVAAVDGTDVLALAATARAALGSQLAPAAVEIHLTSSGPAALAVVVEGTAEGVAARASSVVDLIGGRPGDPPAWLDGYPFADGDVGLKLTSTVTGVGELLVAARDVARRHDVPLAVRASAMGVLYAGLPGDTPADAVARAVAGLRAAAARSEGTLTVLTAPARLRDGLDLWGPVPGLPIMRRIKERFDPGRLLSPGRFVGGL